VTTALSSGDSCSARGLIEEQAAAGRPPGHVVSSDRELLSIGLMDERNLVGYVDVPLDAPHRSEFGLDSVEQLATLALAAIAGHVCDAVRAGSRSLKAAGYEKPPVRVEDERLE
jgi:hypothetical protein